VGMFIWRGGVLLMCVLNYDMGQWSVDIRGPNVLCRKCFLPCRNILLVSS
jgi:hypothetical protein